MLPGCLISPSGIAPVAEGSLTKVQVLLGVARYRSKAKDKGLGILVPPRLTLTGHFSSKATGGVNWGCLMCNTVLLSMLNSSSPLSLSQLLIPNKEAWRAAIHGVAKSRTGLSDWSDLIWTILIISYLKLYHIWHWTNNSIIFEKYS